MKQFINQLKQNGNAQKKGDNQMKETITPTIIKLHPETTNDIYRFTLEITKNLTAAIVSELQKMNTEFTLKVMDEFKERKRDCEKLYNLKELSKIIKINYRTLLSYELPFRTIGKGSRKMYNLNEVIEYLKR